MGFRMLRTAAALVTVLLLAGCVPREPVITPEPDPASTPVFASDEEALAAATEAYARYLEVSDQIFTEGGVEAQRMAAVATGEKLKVELASFSEFMAGGFRGTGNTTFEAATLQEYDQNAVEGERAIVVYLCEDISQTDVLSSSGESVVSADRPSRVKYEVAFDLIPPNSTLLFVSDKVPWSNEPC